MDMNNCMDHDQYTLKYRGYFLDPTNVNQEVTVKTNQQNVVVESMVPDITWSDDHTYQEEDPKVVYLNQYIVKHSLIDKEKILCIVCNLEFTSAKTAKKHSKIHTRDDNAIGDINLGSSSSSKSDKQQDSNFYSCQHCNMSFQDNGLLKKHVSSEHRTKATSPANRNKTVTCELCYKSFAQAAHLTNHLLVHTGVRNFSCQYCDKKFKQRGHVLNHQKIHLDEKNYKCEECGKSFRQTAHLRTHAKIHTGVKDHVCILCSKVFTQSGQLQTHMRTHTNERKYECHLCDMKFKQSGHLQSHVKRHEKKMLREQKEREEEEQEEAERESEVEDDEGIKQEVVEEEIVEDPLTM